MSRLGGGLYGDTYAAEWRDRKVALKRITAGIHKNRLSEDEVQWMNDEISYLRYRKINPILNWSMVSMLNIFLALYTYCELDIHTFLMPSLHCNLFFAWKWIKKFWKKKKKWSDVYGSIPITRKYIRKYFTVNLRFFWVKLSQIFFKYYFIFWVIFVVVHSTCNYY